MQERAGASTTRAKFVSNVLKHRRLLAISLAAVLLAATPGVLGFNTRNAVESSTQQELGRQLASAATATAAAALPGVDLRADTPMAVSALVASTPGVFDAIQAALEAQAPLEPILQDEFARLLALAGIDLGPSAAEFLQPGLAASSPRALEAIQQTLQDSLPETPGLPGTASPQSAGGDNTCPIKRQGGMQITDLEDWLIDEACTHYNVLAAVVGPVLAIVIPIVLIAVLFAVTLVLLAVLFVVSVVGWQVDENGDRVGDAYAEAYGILDDLSDLDGDGPGVIREYQWDTIPVPSVTIGDDTILFPNAQDYDSDGMDDGDEIDYWDANDDSDIRGLGSTVGAAGRDLDAGNDLDKDNATNQHDPDSDDDGLIDGDEYYTHGTYPEFADSDCAADATTCTAVSQTKYQDPLREGQPGSGDLIPDAEEITYWDDYPDSGGYKGDCDMDGIPNILDGDSDSDGLKDGEERVGWEPYGPSDPCNGDTDGDGLKDGAEREALTNPFNPDTDGDGMDDAYEVAYAMEPRMTDESDLDYDGDFLVNIEEYEFGSNPRNPDSDGDLSTDLNESQERTDPSDWDTDDDGMPDWWENEHGLNPRNDADADDDPDDDGPDTDGDGFSDSLFDNHAEYIYGRDGDWNESEDGPWLGGTDPRNPDTDGDEADDGEEAYFGTPARAPAPGAASTSNPGNDFDNDGLDNSYEMASGTDWTDADTDSDGLCDGGGGTACSFGGGEANGLSTNPLEEDTDDDGLKDGAEFFTHSTDPIQRDTDGDEIPDGDEILVHLTNPTLADTDNDGLTDGEELFTFRWEGHEPNPTISDTDFDGLLDGDEVLTHWTNPADMDGDTDNDGLTDFQEVDGDTDPLDEDTDNDRMPDKWEVEMGTKPRVDDAAEDPDHDGIVFGLSNYQEYLIGTHPLMKDTDGDRIDDYWENFIGLDPLADDSQADTDGDGLYNIGEYLLDTKPSVADTDEDGLSDGWEAGVTDPLAGFDANLLRTDPTLLDTDGDGIEDGDELSRWNTIDPNAWQTDYDGDGGNADGNEGLLPDAGVLVGQTHNLRDPDSDNDGFDDGQEWLIFDTEPHLPDTDDDGDSDYVEIMSYATDPRDPESNGESVGAPECGGTGGCVDSDGDRLSDWAETNKYNTDPNDKDTDDDLINDGDERIAWGTNLVNSYLNNPDVDGDGLLDGVEFASSGLDRERFYITSPLLADTDGDGLSDSEEDTNGLAGETAAQGDQATSPPSRPDVPPVPPLPPVPPIPDDPWDVIPCPQIGHGPQSDECLEDQPASSGSPSSGGNGTSAGEDSWWDGVDDVGHYVIGAFGIKLYSTASSHEDPNAGRGSGNRPHSDTRDSENDGLHDGTEYQYGTWEEADTDHDGIPDRCERFNDPDNDNKVNAVDEDSDDDGLLDADEAGGCGSDAGLPDPYDADTDEDGLCDLPEYSGSTGGTKATRADTDADGLSDGLENVVRGPCSTDHRNDWTNENAPLGTIPGRTAFQPYLGPLENPPVVAGCEHVAACFDADRDGIPDGIEEIEPNGLLDISIGETNPRLIDTDEDDLADGHELRVYGHVSLKLLLDRYGGCDACPMTFDWSNLYETDPNVWDTDGDFVKDGADILPKGDALTRLELSHYRQEDKIDASCGGFWCRGYNRKGFWPDAELTTELKAAGLSAGFHTPVIENLQAHPGVVDWRNLFETEGVIWQAGSATVGAKNWLENGVLVLDAPDDIWEIQEEEGLEDIAVIEVSIKDHDVSDDDAVDISPEPGETTYRTTLKVDREPYIDGYSVGQTVWVWPKPAWGGSDGKGDHDDGLLGVRYGTNILHCFYGTVRTKVESAAGDTPSSVPNLPAGQGFGDSDKC